MRRYAFPFILLLSSLELSAAITGFVVDEGGKPIANARVRAIAQESSEAAAMRLMSANPEPPVISTAESGEDGAFRLDPKRQPVVTLLVDAPGFSSHLTEAADGMDVGALVLRAGAAKKGRITAEGKPVANAWVVVNQMFYAKTDERGEYSIPDPGRWFGWLLVLHPDYAPLLRSRTSRDATFSLDATLERGTSVTGRVVDAAGKPVANAIIRDARGPVATSGEDGSFLIPHLAADVKQLRATAGARIASAKPGAATITVRPAAVLTGTVRSSKDDVPVAGAKVMLRGEQNAQMFGTFVITDAKGNFAFDAVPPGPNMVMVAHPLFFSTSDEINLAEGTRTERALVATPATRISGTIVDEQKKPVSGARVGLAPFSMGAYSAPDGSFTLRFPSMERSVTIAASKPSYATATHGPIQLASGESKSGVRIVLSRGTPFEIRLVDPQGTPIVNEPVQINRRLEGERWRRAQLSCAQSEPGPCRTDAEGKLTLNVAEGPYDVTAGGETTVRKELRAQQFTAATTPMTIELERGAVVEGRVVWSDGSPMTATANVISPGAMNVDAPVIDGAFTMRNVPAGKMMLAIRTPPPLAVESEAIEVMAPATGVVLKMPRPGRIEGRVVDRDTQRPVRQFSANMEARGGRRYGSSGKGFTSEDGRFVLEDIPPGMFDVIITAPGYVRSSAAAVEVVEGKAATVEVALDRGAIVLGRVTSAGRPLAGAALSIDDPGRSQLGARQTDANGDFTLDSVAPGARELRVRKDGYVERVVSVNAVAGKETRADVELSRGREIHGRVVDPSGVPVVGAAISRRSPRENDRPLPWSQNTTDAEGMFRLDGLSDEPVVVTATKEGFAPGSTEVNPATATMVTITLNRGGTISGRVAGLSRAELAMVEVFAFGSRAPMPNRMPVDPTGAFTLTGVPDGELTVSAEIQQPRRNVRTQVTVTNGTAPFVELDFAAGFTVRGRVTRAGKPIRGNIFFSSADPRDRSRSGSGELRPDGTYEARVNAAGEYRVHVSPSDGTGTVTATTTVTVRGDTTHDVDIRGAAVTGRVVDAATGAPMPNVRVSLVATGTSSSTRTTDSAGRFVFEFVAEGTHTVQAGQEGYAGDSREIVIAGASAPEVELALARGELVEVRVVDAGTKRELGAFVGAGRAAATRGSDRVYRLWLRPGNHSLHVGATGYKSKSVPLAVPAPGPIVVELEVKPE